MVEATVKRWLVLPESYNKTDKGSDRDRSGKEGESRDDKSHLGILRLVGCG